MTVAPVPILPRIDDLNRPFWDGCRDGRLRLQACTACGHLRYPISSVCPRCLSDGFEWRDLSGRGEIVSWVVFEHSYHPAWADQVPYNVVLVQLAEGPRVFGNVEPITRRDLAVGMPVSVVFVPGQGAGDDAAILIPRWAPA